MRTAYAAQLEPDQVAGETASELANLLQMIIQKIPLWIAAGTVIVITLFIAKLITNIVEGKVADKIDDDHQEIQVLAGRITYFAVLVIGITVAFNIAGIDITSIVAAAALGIGFALKDLIMNFLAGVMILVGNHFSIGDFIRVNGTLGKVIEIQSRVTILQAIDGTKVIVPNSEIFLNQVISYTSNPFRRIEVVVGVTYGTDLEKASRVALETMQSIDGVLASPAPAVLVDSFGESSIILNVRAWVESRSGWLRIKSNLVQTLKRNFDANQIKIPFPIRTIVNEKSEKQVPANAPKINQTPTIQQVPVQSGTIISQ